MCGIVGVTGNKNTVQILLNGLEKLEYRGYDSAGIYVNDQNGYEKLIRTKGRIKNLRLAVDDSVHGTTGIGHTRWATHGEPSVANAHPQFSSDNRFYLVHNGVIENFQELKAEYLANVDFQSQTDTEVIVQLIDRFVVKDQLSTLAAFRKTLSLLGNSSYAFQLIDQQEPDTLYVAKNKSPLLIGVGDGFNVVCSDSLAMLDQTKDFLELHDGEIVIVKPDTIKIIDQNGATVERSSFHVDIDAAQADKGTYPFYMLKEIDEQPNVMRKLSQVYLNDAGEPVISSELLAAMNKADRLYIVAAGTSYHAGLVGAKMFEKLVQLPTEVHVSSEFAYNQPLLSQRPFFIFLTQSGETADSREVLLNVNKQHFPSLTITNVPNSTLSREATYTLLLHAGPEIAVASTKAYTAQIAVQAILAKALGKLGNIQAAADFNIYEQLSLVANGMQALVDEKASIEQLAKTALLHSRNAFYIGRGTDYAVSLEAALKLKEISYVQAEGFASGELKHGTIALIEKGTPVIGIITQANTAKLTRSNLQEVAARGGQTITIVSENLAQDDDQITIPVVEEMLTPLLSVVPAQLLAYFTSLNKGLDVDKPRNLAKSVTVE